LSELCTVFIKKFTDYKATGTFLRSQSEINFDRTILIGLPQNEAQAHVIWL